MKGITIIQKCCKNPFNELGLQQRFVILSPVRDRIRVLVFVCLFGLNVQLQLGSFKDGVKETRGA